MPPHLRKMNIDKLNREPIYEDIHRTRTTRKIQPTIGFTLIEEVKRQQLEYLRNHGMINASMEDVPKENQTMEDYRRPLLHSKGKSKEKARRNQRIPR